MTEADLFSSVLIVEDSKDLLNLYQMALVDMSDVRIDYVVSGTDALLAFKEISYDLVIVDIGLPDFSGYELADKIKESLPQEHWPQFCAVSGYAHQEARQKSESEGFLAHISKPIMVDQIRLLVRTGQVE